MSKKWWIWSVVGKLPYKTKVLRRRLECFINYLPLLAFVKELCPSATQENACQSPEHTSLCCTWKTGQTLGTKLIVCQGLWFHVYFKMKKKNQKQKNPKKTTNPTKQTHNQRASIKYEAELINTPTSVCGNSSEEEFWCVNVPYLFQREWLHVPETVFSGLMLAVSLFWGGGKEIKPHCSVLSAGCKLGQWVREV